MAIEGFFYSHKFEVDLVSPKLKIQAWHFILENLVHKPRSCSNQTLIEWVFFSKLYEQRLFLTVVTINQKNKEVPCADNRRQRTCWDLCGSNQHLTGANQPRKRVQPLKALPYKKFRFTVRAPIMTAMCGATSPTKATGPMAAVAEAIKERTKREQPQRRTRGATARGTAQSLG